MERCFVSYHQPAFKPYDPETEVRMSLESENHSRVVTDCKQSCARYQNWDNKRKTFIFSLWMALEFLFFAMALGVSLSC